MRGTVSDAKYYLFWLTSLWVLSGLIFTWWRSFKFFLRVEDRLGGLGFIAFCTKVSLPGAHPVKQEVLAKLPDQAKAELADLQKKQRIFAVIALSLVVISFFV